MEQLASLADPIPPGIHLCAASPDLRPWISFYVIINDPQPSPDAPTTIFAPAIPTAKLTVHLDGIPSYLDASGRRIDVPRYTVAGPNSQLASITNDAKPAFTVTVLFRPGAWNELTVNDASGIADSFDDATRLFQNGGDDLAARLETGPTTQVIPRLENWLRRVVRKRATNHPLPYWLRHRMTEGSPAAVADRFGMSRRQFERRFRQTIGLSPNVYQRLIRLYAVHQRLLAHELRGDPIGTVADLAADFGYYDQSHLDRDVRSFNDLSFAEVRQRISQGDPSFAILRQFPPDQLL